MKTKQPITNLVKTSSKLVDNSWEIEFENKFNDVFIILEQDYPTGAPSIKKHIKQFISQLLQKQREDLIEEIEKVFDQFRSSSVKERGKRIFGVAGFGVNARRLHDDILEKLKK